MHSVPCSGIAGKNNASIDDLLHRHGPKEFDLRLTVSGESSTSTPFGVSILKGSKNVALTREFVDFILTNEFVWRFREWLRHTAVPDEHFYSTLSSITKVEDLHKDGKGKASDLSRRMSRFKVLKTILAHPCMHKNAIAVLQPDL